MTLEDIEDLEVECNACLGMREIPDPEDRSRMVMCGLCRGVGKRLTAEGEAMIEFITRHAVLDARDIAKGLRNAETFDLKAKSSM